MIKNAIVTAILAVCSCLYTTAQLLNEKEYRARSKEVAAEIWNENNPAFKVTEIPAEFSNESAVIIAKSSVLIYTTKSHGPVTHEFKHYKVRVRVKINDKSALNDFSFIEYQKSLDRQYTFIGAKVIKPDGKEIIVDVDEEILTKDEKRNKEGKLAISDLQIGDILDYYTEKESSGYASEGIQGTYKIYLADEYPIMNLSFHMELDKDAGTMYANANGAPPPIVSVGKDNATFIDLELKNTSKYNLAKWILPMRQVPCVRIQYKMLNKKTDRKTDFNRGTVIRTSGAEKMYEDLRVNFEYAVSPSYEPGFKSTTENDFGGKKKLRSASVDSVVKKLFNNMLDTYSWQWILSGQDDMKNFKEMMTKNVITHSAYFADALSYCNIPAEIIYVPPRYGPFIKDFLAGDQLVPIIHVKGSRDYWIGIDELRFFSTNTPWWAEGEDAKGFLVSGKEKDLQYKLPVSNSEQNMILENLDVSFVPGNLQSLQIKRATSLTGHYMEEGISNLQSVENYCNSLSITRGKEETIRQSLEASKRYLRKPLIQNGMEALVKDAQTQKGKFEAEIKDQYDQAPKEVVSYKVSSQTADYFNYESEFAMDNWVKKAGNNYIVEAGRLIGNNKKVEEKERTRTLDIYMPFANTLDYTFNLAIPEGYNAKGLESFNKSISNETGSFISTATLSGNKVLFRVKRIYNSYHQPAAQWLNLLQLMDASYDFTQQKILLEKAK